MHSSLVKGLFVSALSFPLGLGTHHTARDPARRQYVRKMKKRLKRAEDQSFTLFGQLRPLGTQGRFEMLDLFDLENPRTILGVGIAILLSTALPRGDPAGACAQSQASTSLLSITSGKVRKSTELQNLPQRSKRKI